jgi:predicted RNA-binding Zn ribbon-like protein
MVTLSEPHGADQPLFVDFVNTLHWYEGVPVELIGTDADLATWLAERDLPPTILTGLHTLRAHLRAATEALAAAKTPATVDLDVIGGALSTPAGRLVLLDPEGPRPQLALTVDGMNHALAAFRIALSFANFLASGDRHHLKLCANPGCGFAFLDTSTNGTRRWCFMRYCGNRTKARAFRRRHNATVS